MTTSEGDARDSEEAATSYGHEPGAPFGDPLDIRDPRNVDERSPIEGATHKSLGVSPVESKEVGDNPQLDGDEVTTTTGEPVNDGDSVRINKEIS